MAQGGREPQVPGAGRRLPRPRVVMRARRGFWMVMRLGSVDGRGERGMG